MTPRLLFVLHERWIEHNKRNDYRAGVLAMILYNKDLASTSDAKDAAFFFPSLAEAGSTRGRVQSTEEQLAIVAQLNALFGGKDLRKRGNETS